MKNAIIAMLMLVTVTSCSFVPEYKQPEVAIPEAWKNGDKGTEAEIAPDWWKLFKSDELDALMDEALENNLDLKAALARIEQSRALARIAGAPLVPSVDATGTLGGTETNPSKGPDHWAPRATGGLAVSYELDLFGANRAGAKAAAANLLNSAYTHDALRLVVMGDVAQGYFRLLNLRERQSISQQNLNNLKEVLKVAQARFDAGSTSAIDVSRQKTELSISEASLAALKNQTSAAENALAVLLGRAPQDLGLKAKNLKRVKEPKVPLTQPMSVLARRPDIRAAEQSLLAANADIGAARAAFFPSIDIGGTAALAFSPLTSPVATTLTLLGTASAPIFRGGLLKGGLERASARQVELTEIYRKTVLVSLQEAEDAIAAIRAAKQRQSSFANAVKEARKTYELSRGLYEAGSVDYQNMLDAERTLLSAEDSYATVKLEMLTAQVNLYRALGGGWVDWESVAKK